MIQIKQTNQEFIKYDLVDGNIEITYKNVTIQTQKSLLFDYNGLCLIVVMSDKYMWFIPDDSGAGHRQPYGVFEVDTQTLLIKDKLDEKLSQTFVCCVNMFLQILREHTNLYDEYVSNKQPKHLCTTSVTGHWGHIVRDQIPSMCRLLNEHNIHTLFYKKTSEKLFRYKNLFERVSIPIKLYEMTNTNGEEILIYSLKNNLFFYKKYGEKPYDGFLFDEIKKLYCTNNSQDLQQDTKTILLVGKYDYRSPVNQLDLFVNIIKFYLSKWKDVGFFVQGFVSMLDSSYQMEQNSFAPLVEAGDRFFNSLKEIFPQVKLINLNKTSIEEYIRLIQNVKMYFTPYGSLQHLAYAFTKGNGIVYGMHPGELTGYKKTTMLLPRDTMNTDINFNNPICGIDVNINYRFKSPQEHNYEVNLEKFIYFLKEYHARFPEV